VTDNNEHIVIITGATPLAPSAVQRIPIDAIILAADGGLDHALAAGLAPSGLIGDLDSITDEGLNWAARNATIDRHPPDKDTTDTELALAFAAAMNPLKLTLIGGGDRLDHTFAALGALGAPNLTSIGEIDGWWGGQHLVVLHGPGKATLRLVAGSTLSLLALHGPCGKVTIRNVRWPLDKVTLEPMVGRGLSNVVLDADPADVEVGLSSGVLTIFDVPAEAP
jgi:thiamine pyrophosphokinase